MKRLSEKLILVKDLVKLCGLVLLFILFGNSCVDSSNRYYLKDKCPDISYIRKCQFENHDYLLFCEGGTASGSGYTRGVVHDPNCKKCSYERQILE